MAYSPNTSFVTYPKRMMHH